eukprot:12437469-Ditylum_brightwellii.AAC.1
MALVRNDTNVDGKRNSFETTASFLLPHNPMTKKHTAEQPHAEISSIESERINLGMGKIIAEL